MINSAGVIAYMSRHDPKVYVESVRGKTPFLCRTVPGHAECKGGSQSVTR